MSVAGGGAAGIVTPEAVRLQFKEANVGSRGVALILDLMALGFASSVLNTALSFLIVAGSQTVQPWVAVTVLLILNFLLFFGYPIASETLMGGHTLGKLLMGLRVVTVEGAPVRFRHAAIRAALWLVDFPLTLGMGAVFTTMFSRRHQRLGDIVAGTVVLRERTGEAMSWPAQFTVPRGAESYAITLDPSGISAADYELVRNFLLRAHTFTEPSRRDVGGRLAAGLAAQLHHQRPPTVSDELFLSCLAARYQQTYVNPAWAAQPTPSGAQPSSGQDWTAPEPPARDDSSPPDVARPPDAPEQGWGDFSAPR